MTWLKVLIVRDHFGKKMKFLTGRQNAMNTANISESDWYEHFESLFSANLNGVDILVNLPNDELSEIEDAISMMK